jgi:ankyrin repeat protein
LTKSTQYGANIESINKAFQTPLHLAASFDKSQCVKLLVERYAQKNSIVLIVTNVKAIFIYTWNSKIN